MEEVRGSAATWGLLVRCASSEDFVNSRDWVNGVEMFFGGCIQQNLEPVYRIELVTFLMPVVSIQGLR